MVQEREDNCRSKVLEKVGEVVIQTSQTPCGELGLRKSTISPAATRREVVGTDRCWCALVLQIQEGCCVIGSAF